MIARVSVLRASRAWRVGLRLAACAAVVALLVWVANADGVMSVIQGGFARVSGAVLGLFGERVSVDGNVVRTDRFAISVVTACTGLFLTGLFAAAVIASPARLRAKLVGIGIGVTGIFAVNVVRLVSLYYVGVHLPGLLDIVHLLIWQSLLIAFAVGLWLLWAGTWGRRPGREAAE